MSKYPNLWFPAFSWNILFYINWSFNDDHVRKNRKQKSPLIHKFQHTYISYTYWCQRSRKKMWQIYYSNVITKSNIIFLYRKIQEFYSSHTDIDDESSKINVNVHTYRSVNVCTSFEQGSDSISDFSFFLKFFYSHIQCFRQ